MSGNRVVWLNPTDPPDAFPDIDRALREPDGLLAAGGDLSEARLLTAYARGIFPWYDEGQPVLWWSPNPRCILRPEAFHLARRLRREIRSSAVVIRFNTAFDDVMRECAAPRAGQHGTWITADMMAAYSTLHAGGWAHSVEAWVDDELVGGIYGIGIGRMFFGESMFSRVDNASKMAMLALSRALRQRAVPLIDCQVASPHLFTIGAELMPRDEFRQIVESACRPRTRFDSWPGEYPVSEFGGD